MLSQWPNGNGEFAEFYHIESSNEDMFGFYEDNPLNWTEAKDLYTGGYFGYDYNYERIGIKEINTFNKTISLMRGEDLTFNKTSFGVISTQSKRWKVYNLLEEIDIPGEYYIDKENLILYYYPTEDYKTSKFELAIMKDYVFNLNSAKNIEFKNLVFQNFCGTVFYVQNGIENISIDGCIFRNVGVHAINTNSTKRSVLSSSVDATYGYGVGKNLAITNNVFYNIGDVALTIGGLGELDNYAPGGVVISYNFANNCASKAMNVSFLGIGDIEAQVKNNVVTNSPDTAINYGGMNNNISYNEIHRSTKYTVDAGAIYSGRSAIQRGTEISYNLITDSNPVVEPLNTRFIHNRGIYFDDSLSGQIAHHNIVVNAEKCFTSGGSSNNIYSNIFVDSQSSGEIYINSNPDSIAKRYTEIVNSTSISEDIKEKFYTNFPQWKLEADSITDGLCYTKFMKVNNNLFVNTQLPIVPENFVAQGNEFNGNLTADKTLFVNADEKDYRILNGSTVLTQNPDLLSESFDMGSIGFSVKDKFENLKEEIKIHSTSYNQVHWNKVFGSDCYVVEIAKDVRFLEPVLNKTVYDNCLTDININNGSYYVRVTAKGTSRSLNFEIKSEIKTIDVNKDETTADYILYTTADSNYSEGQGMVDAVSFDGIEGAKGRAPRAVPNRTASDCKSANVTWKPNVSGEYVLAVGMCAQRPLRSEMTRIGPIMVEVKTGNLFSTKTYTYGPFEPDLKAGFIWIDDVFNFKGKNWEYVKIYGAEDTWGSESKHFAVDCIKLINVNQATKILDIKSVEEDGVVKSKVTMFKNVSDEAVLIQTLTEDDTLNDLSVTEYKTNRGIFVCEQEYEVDEKFQLNTLLLKNFETLKPLDKNIVQTKK